jgi:hypothetical protein
MVNKITVLIILMPGHFKNPVLHPRLSVDDTSVAPPTKSVDAKDQEDLDIPSDDEGTDNKNKNINPHSFGQDSMFFRQLFDKLSPPCVVCPVTAPVPGLLTGMRLSSINISIPAWWCMIS